MRIEGLGILSGFSRRVPRVITDDVGAGRDPAAAKLNPGVRAQRSSAAGNGQRQLACSLAVQNDSRRCASGRLLTKATAI
jgi:hypothetical protein